MKLYKKKKEECKNMEVAKVTGYGSYTGYAQEVFKNDQNLLVGTPKKRVTWAISYTCGIQIWTKLQGRKIWSYTRYLKKYELRELRELHRNPSNMNKITRTEITKKTQLLF